MWLRIDVAEHKSILNNYTKIRTAPVLLSHPSRLDNKLSKTGVGLMGVSIDPIAPFIMFYVGSRALKLPPI